MFLETWVFCLTTTDDKSLNPKTFVFNTEKGISYLTQLPSKTFGLGRKRGVRWGKHHHRIFVTPRSRRIEVNYPHKHRTSTVVYVYFPRPHSLSVGPTQFDRVQGYVSLFLGQGSDSFRNRGFKTD